MMIPLLYDAIMVIPFVLTASSFVHKFLMKDTHPAAWISVTLLVSIYMLLMRHLKLKGRGSLLGAALSVALAILIFLPSGERVAYIVEHFGLLREFFAATLCFIIGLSARYYRKLRILIVSLGIISLPFFLIEGINLDKFPVCMLFFYALTVLVDEIQRHTRKEGDSLPEKHLVFVSPFIILILVITALIKVPDRPYDWSFVHRMSQKLKSGYVMLQENLFPANGWDSDSPIIGFSDRSGFAGNLTQGCYPVMDIYAFSECDSRLYLSGRTFDSFNGESWEKTDTSVTDEDGYDTLETISAVMDNTGDEPLSDMIKPASIKIEYSDLRTSYMFSPAKLVTNPEKYPDMEGGDIRFANKKRSKEPYRLSYYRVNRGNPDFEKLLDKGHVISRSSFANAGEKSGSRELNYEGYLAYRDMLYQTYMTDPKLSSSLRQYMDERLAGADTDYKKLLRIEGLFKDFSYSDNPGILPEKVTDESSFLDYFILEKKEGYCSHFATSFVLLARAYGIPARYVQGFRIPAGTRSHIEVLSSYAHAWPEAYIDGVGWFAFEPTPGFLSTTSWETAQEAAIRKRNVAKREAVVLKEETAEDEAAEDIAISVRWYHIIIPPLSGIALILFLLAADGIIKKRRYKKMCDRDKCLWICHRNLELLKRIKAGRMAHETVCEYRDRISCDIPKKLLEFCKVYEELLYSDNAVSADVVKVLEDNHRGIKKYVRERSFFRKLIKLH